MPRTAAPDPAKYGTKSAVLASKKTPSKRVVLKLPDAHPKQHELITALDTRPGCRFVVGACGSKFGKTFGLASAIIKNAWEHENSLNWWVAPTYKQSDIAFKLIKRILPENSFKEYKADLILELLTPGQKVRSTIEFKSGDNPDTLRGYGIDFFVMDEAARCPYESYISVWTTVTQRFGKGFFISTPKGKNWFYDVYRQGEKYADDGVTPLYAPGEDPHPEWFSMRMPTWHNPHVKVEAIRQLQKNLPEDTFRQEIAARFMLDSAGVFRGASQCVRGVLQPAMPGKRYVFGVDLGRLKDYTVLIVMDQSNSHVVYFERFNKISWELQETRIAEVAARYNNALTVVDSTGIGDPIVGQLKLKGVRVDPYSISSSTAKKQLVDKLRVDIEHQKVSFPNIPILIRELDAYEYKLSESGVIKFSAPAGMHDDCVIALCLANWRASQAPLIYKHRNVRGI